MGENLNMEQALCSGPVEPAGPFHCRHVSHILDDRFKSGMKQPLTVTPHFE